MRNIFFNKFKILKVKKLKIVFFKLLGNLIIICIIMLLQNIKKKNVAIS